MERLRRLRLIPEHALSQVGEQKLVRKEDWIELLGARYPHPHNTIHDPAGWDIGRDGRARYVGPEPIAGGGFRRRGPVDSARIRARMREAIRESYRKKQAVQE